MKESNPNRDVAGEDLEQLANALGYPELAAAYQRALDSPGVGPDTMALRSHHAGSYMVCPSSWREKMVPRAARLMRRVRVRR